MVSPDNAAQEVRNYLEQVHAAARRAANIVRNLLAFVRHSALERCGCGPERDHPVGRRAPSRSSSRASAIDLVEHYSLDLPLTVVNREEIQQVILNLMMNAEHAVIATGQPGVVRVRTGESGACAWVEVSDNGPGVPPAMISQVFEPFFTTKGVGREPALGSP